MLTQTIKKINLYCIVTNTNEHSHLGSSSPVCVNPLKRRFSSLQSGCFARAATATLRAGEIELGAPRTDCTVSEMSFGQYWL